MKYAHYLLIVCSCLLASVDVLTNEWRGLTPLHSTRSDVERILGVKTSGKALDQFTIDGDRVSILYNVERCEEGKTTGFNVPPGTILEITVSPKRTIPISDLHLDMSKFEIEYTDSAGELSYENSEDGLYIIAVHSRVRAITYGRSSKDRHLICQGKN